MMGDRTTPMLRLSDITVHYNAVCALRATSLVVHEGEAVSLIGPNGAGKSTTLKAICGLVPVTSGTISFFDRSIIGMRTHQLVRQGLSLVPEDRHVFPSMSVRENLLLGGYILRSRARVLGKIDQVCQLFPVLAERMKQRAGTLSSGEQQMLSMARGFLLEPRLLLLDEPSFALSPNYVRLVFDKIREIRELGTTILLVEQNARMALENSDRTYVFRIGGVELEGPSAQLVEDPLVRKTYLGQ